MRNQFRFALILVLLLAARQLFGQGGIDKPRYQIVTYRDTAYLGAFEIELFPLIAPLHVQNFDSLVAAQAYDSTAFHRVVPGFVIQGGDPNSISGPVSTWGQGQPSQPTVNAEFSVVRHLRGILGAARDTNINSANSQFYICVAPATFLDGNYTVYGKVTSGMTVVDTIVMSPANANDLPDQKISMFITYTGVNDTVPDPPALVSPADNSVNINTTQTFRWTTVPGAVMYTVQFSTDSLFSAVVLEKDAGLNEISNLPLSGSNTYYWRVVSNNGGHESVPSNVWKFSMITAAPNLIAPVDSAQNVFLNPVMQWSAVPLANNYTLQVSTSAIFIPSQIQFNLAGLTDTLKQISTLNPNTRYYWRVRSFNGTIPGIQSARYTFLTGTASGMEHLSLAEMIRAVYPNPAIGIFNAEFRLQESAPAYVELKDLQGRIVYSEKLDYQPVLHTVIDVSHLPKAAYMLELTNGKYFSTAKVLVR